MISRYWQKRIDKHFAEMQEFHLARWPEEDRAIDDLANERTPLNDRFAEGKGVIDGLLLRYIAALERRVAALEEKKSDS